MIDQFFKSIILNIIKELQYNRIGFGKTRLIKLAYLVELENLRRFGKRLTEVEWIYYKYGPYIMDFDSYIADKKVTIEDDDTPFTKVILADMDSIKPVNRDIQRIISGIVKEFGDINLHKLLDFVYFNTEPMMKAEERGETLDFSTVLPITYYRITDYKVNESLLKELLKELAEKKKHAHRI